MYRITPSTDRVCKPSNNFKSTNFSHSSGALDRQASMNSLSVNDLFGLDNRICLPTHFVVYGVSIDIPILPSSVFLLSKAPRITALIVSELSKATISVPSYQSRMRLHPAILREIQHPILAYLVEFGILTEVLKDDLVVIQRICIR